MTAGWASFTRLFGAGKTLGRAREVKLKMRCDLDCEATMNTEVIKSTTQGLMLLSDTHLMALMFLALVVLMWKVLDVLSKRK